MTSRTLAFLEPLTLFAGIMTYIWKLRFYWPWSWIPLVGLVVLSHVLRHRRAAALGFRLKHLGDCVKKFGPALAAFAVAACGVGWLAGTMRPLGFEQAAEALGLYLPWGLFQQYLMNAYFLDRFEAALDPRIAALLTAALFAAAHLPNHFLMLVTAASALIAIPVYRRYRNLYFLGAAHAMIGFLLFLVVPDSISHHLNVGPGMLGH